VKFPVSELSQNSLSIYLAPIQKSFNTLEEANLTKEQLEQYQKRY